MISPEILASCLQENRRNRLYFYKNGERVSKTHPAILQEVKRLLCYCRSLGIKSGERIGIIGDTTYEWMLVDLACILGGYVSIALHNNQFESDVNTAYSRYSLVHAFVGDKYIKEIDAKRTTLFSHISKIIESEGDMELDAVAENGKYAHSAFTVYFTSGTTASPKPLGLTLESCGKFMERTLELFTFSSEDKILIFLPFSAIIERIYVYMGIIIGFDLLIVPVQNISRALRLDKPTILVAVPHFYETIYDTIWQNLEEKPLKRAILHGYLKIWKVFPEKVSEKIRSFILADIRSFWGDKMRLLLCGSAPLKSRILEFHEAIGLPIYQGYGISEIGMVALNTQRANKSGSVGRPFPGKRITFDHQGQILVHTSEPFSNGYIELECTGASFFDNGQPYETGDVGYMDDDGFIYIKGRIKEIIVLSNGKKIHPNIIEEMLNSSYGIRQSVVFGEGHPYLIALLVKRDKTISDETIEREIKRINGILPEHLKIRRFFISIEALTVENECLTMTMKPNRKVSWKRFQTNLAALYESKGY